MRYLTAAAVLLAMSLSGELAMAQQAEAQDAEVAPYAGLADWQADRDARMEWWREARFGMFVHWGLYSAAGGYWPPDPATGRKYEQHYAEWIQNWAKVPSGDYAAEVKIFFAPRPGFAERWAALAKEAGMRYAVLTTKHHEGFTLFNSDAPYSIGNKITGGTNISPPGRDCVREYADAMRAAGLKVGFYYSLLDWQHPDAYTIALPVPAEGERDSSLYVDYMHHHVMELLTNYGRIDILWPDFSGRDTTGRAIEGSLWGASRLLEMVRGLQPHVVVNNRLWRGLENRNGDFATPEKYVPATGIPGLDWEVCHTMNESFGFSFHDQNWKTASDVIRLLVDTAGKGGNLLLNVGPDARGDIPEASVRVLREVGEWMKRNGEAIHGTTANPFPAMPFDGRCTVKALPGGNSRLFLHLFEWPLSGMVSLEGLKNRVIGGMVLGAGTAVAVKGEPGKTAVKLPAGKPAWDVPVVAVDIKGAPEVETPPYAVQRADGIIVMRAADGLVRGETLRSEHSGNNLGSWSEAGDVAFFPFLVRRPGEYQLLIDMAVAPDSGGRFEVLLGDDLRLVGEATPTGSWSHYRERSIGTVELRHGGHDFILVRPLEIEGSLMNLKSIRLVPKE